MERRSIVSVALLAASVGLVAVLVSLDAGSPAEPGQIPVTVVFPGGVMHGNYTLVEATAFSALQAMAQDHGWRLDVEGSGERLFVVGIDGVANQGAGGWCYAVWDGGFVQPSYSAALAGLQDGQAVRWSYEPDGCKPSPA